MEGYLNDSTAHEILKALKRRGKATVAELSQEFGLTGMAVRHHLSSLRARGFVSSTHERHGVGRPTETFCLTEFGDELFPRHYDQLATDILEMIETIEGKEKTAEVFNHRMQRQLEEHSKRLEGLSFEEKVAEVAQILSEDGFQADYEKRGDEYLLTEHNCAVSKIAEHFNQLCTCELNLIAELLNADVSRQQYKVAGDHCCSYAIRKRTKP